MYFYLGDYRAGGLRGVEEGEGFSGGAQAVGVNGDGDASSSRGSGSGAKPKEEQYEVSPNKAE